MDTPKKDNKTLELTASDNGKDVEVALDDSEHDHLNPEANSVEVEEVGTSYLSPKEGGGFHGLCGGELAAFEDAQETICVSLYAE